MNIKLQAICKSIKLPRSLHTQKALLLAALSGAPSLSDELFPCVLGALSHRTLLGSRLI